MVVDCQEAMGVEAQAPERIVAPGASISTIESLRARLLSERAASKEARQHVHKVALQVSELQSRLDAEIQHRKKAEAAMKEVLEVLRAEGVAMEEAMAAVSLTSGSSECDEVAQSSSSKDGECDNSSGEDGSHQGSAAEVSRTESVTSQREARGSSEDSSSDKTQIASEDSDISEMEKGVATKDKAPLRSDNAALEGSDIFGTEKGVATKDKAPLRSDISEVGKQGLSANEEVNNQKPVVFMDALEENSHTLWDQVGEESDISQPPKRFGDFTKHSEAQVMASNDCKPDGDSADGSPSKSFADAVASYQEVESNNAASMSPHQVSGLLPNKALLSHMGDVENWKGHESAPIAQAPSGLGNNGAHGGEQLHPVQDKMARGLLTPREMVPPLRGNTIGLGHTHMNPGIFPRGGYLYERPCMHIDPIHYIHSAEAPFFVNTAYGVEYGRYLPQAPVNDAVLSLMDDKSGKLGSILMALNLAKQQINNEEYATAYAEEVCEAASPSRFGGKPYLGLYEGVPHQPPYHPWRPEPQNEAPIVHFPMSPTSDYEASAFERSGVRRSSSSSVYYMTGYDPYVQGKGELHLGNGITLYTD